MPRAITAIKVETAIKAAIAAITAIKEETAIRVETAIKEETGKINDVSGQRLISSTGPGVFFTPGPCFCIDREIMSRIIDYWFVVPHSSYTL